ncbi:MAG: YggT family protein [Actinobacteria bacterium]|nr:YggT family protein [Actinomycetota bacterium]MCB9412312.1 YggT family protein [Actinomycetota bacterium]
MSSIGQIVATVLWLYILVLFARFAFDLIQMFSRDWTPKGIILVLAEAVYTVTDPPLKFLRRFIPPLRLGGVALDLSFLVLLILLQVGIAVASAL